MIEIYYLKNQKIQHASDINDCKSIINDILWIDIKIDDSQKENDIEDLLNIGILTPKEALSLGLTSRNFEEGDKIVVNSNVIIEHEHEIVNDNITFTIHKNIVLSTRHINYEPFITFGQKLINNEVKAENGLEVFLHLLEYRVELDADRLELLGNEVGILSKAISIEKHLNKQNIYQISNLRDHFMVLMQNFIDKQRLITFLKRSSLDLTMYNENLHLIVQDITNLSEFIKFNFERLDHMDAAISNLIVYEQNNIAKIFTVATIIIMPPTLIAGIYGMNFEIMPEIRWHYGYPFAIILMMCSVVFTLVFFKIKKWL